MSVMHWPFCPAIISCCYQHVFYFVQINMDGWMDGNHTEDSLTDNHTDAWRSLTIRRPYFKTSRPVVAVRPRDFSCLSEITRIFSSSTVRFYALRGAYSHKIWCRCMYPVQSYWHFSEIQDGGRRHLRFSVYVNLAIPACWLCGIVFCTKFGSNICYIHWDRRIYASDL